MNKVHLPITPSLPRRSLLKGLGAAAIGISFGAGTVGCSNGQQSGTENSPRGGAEQPLVNFYNWDTYIGETTLDDFTSASGINVNLSLFASNDELVAKLRAGGSGFDLIVPANDTVERLIATKMVAPLDHSLIPNIKNISSDFADPPYDPGLRHSMPYTWLALGIGYRKSRVKIPPTSWKALLDSDQYKGRISLISESSILFHVGAKYLGHSLNALTPDLITQIEDMLIRQKRNIVSFHDDNGQDLLLSREVDLVMEYNGDIAQIMAEDDDIGFIIPSEGSELSADSLCIPIDAPRPKNAHAMINFLLDAKVGADIANTILYPTPNAAARELAEEFYRNDPVIFPPAATLARCEYARFNRDLQARFERSITRIRAA